MMTASGSLERDAGGSQWPARAAQAMVHGARHAAAGLLALGRPWLPVACWASVAYLLSNMGSQTTLPTELRLYVVDTLLWISVALMGYLGWRYAVAEKPAFNAGLAFGAYAAAVLQIAVSCLAGLVYGFGRSPYGFRLEVLAANFLYWGTMLVAVELCRASMVLSMARRHALLALVSASLFCSMFGIPMAKWASLSGPGNLLAFTGGTFLPALAENILASYLVLVGGPAISILYRSILQAFAWDSPFLPDLPWMVKALLGTVVPALMLIALTSASQARLQSRERGPARAMNPWAGWVLVVCFGVAMLWFNAGYLGLSPSVISGQSMLPALAAGDLVITRDVAAEDVHVGDIIRFRQGEVDVIHRVVDIVRDDGGVFFVTRGDANNVADGRVPLTAFEGKVIAVVPKIGWVTLGVRRVVQRLGGVP
jgi:signal peptidase